MDFQTNQSINESATDLFFAHDTHRAYRPNPVSTPQYVGDVIPLPTRSDADAILIGSFADCKPVQAFLQTRKLTHTTGRNWYMLEYENYGKDFGLQKEFRQYERIQALDELDVIYPRARRESLFVHARLITKSTQFYQWLKRGAYLYVGTLQYSIDETLLRIIQKEGRLNRKDAIGFLNALRESDRLVVFGNANH